MVGNGSEVLGAGCWAAPQAEGALALRKDLITSAVARRVSIQSRMDNRDKRWYWRRHGQRGRKRTRRRTRANRMDNITQISKG